MLTAQVLRGYVVSENDLGRHIAEARERQGWTQEELAQRLGAHEMTISKWERGENRPTATNLARLAKELEVSEAELVLGPMYLRESRPLYPENGSAEFHRRLDVILAGESDETLLDLAIATRAEASRLEADAARERAIASRLAEEQSVKRGEATKKPPLDWEKAETKEGSSKPPA